MHNYGHRDIAAPLQASCLVAPREVLKAPRQCGIRYRAVTFCTDVIWLLVTSSMYIASYVLAASLRSHAGLAQACFAVLRTAFLSRDALRTFTV